MRIGPLILESRLARGGMAEVWRGRAADDADALAESDHIVAGALPRGVPLCIKRLDPGVVADIDFVEMFRDEARIALAFAHDNVVKTYALIDDAPGGQPSELLLAMELVSGPSLSQLMSALRRAEPPLSLSTAEALAIALQLARALHHVHTMVDDGAALNVVHRDVSPHNVLVGEDGRVVLIDFGVARAAARLTRTRAGTLKGKAAYMAPEQVKGEAIDARTDQFAWGVVVWEMLCGRQLFSGTDELRVLHQIERPDITAPSFVRSLGDDGAAIDAVVMRALSPLPQSRYADMGAVAADVAALAGADVDDVVRGLMARAAAALADDQAPSRPAQRTRVVAVDRQRALAVEDTAPPPPRQSSRTSSSSSSSSLSSRSLPLAGGAALVGLALVVAIALAMPPGGSVTTALTPISSSSPSSTVSASNATTLSAASAARVTTMLATLRAASAHPCRLELEDELIRTRTLTDAIVAELDVDVAACITAAEHVVEHQAALRRFADVRLVPPVSTSKSKSKRASAARRRLSELKRRCAIALDAGDHDAAISLAEAAASQSKDDVLARRYLFEAYRRAGKAAAAGVEARALIALDADPASRLRRWLSDHDLPP